MKLGKIIAGYVYLISQALGNILIFIGMANTMTLGVGYMNNVMGKY
jgi:hypothetical protein